MTKPSKLVCLCGLNDWFDLCPYNSTGLRMAMCIRSFAFLSTCRSFNWRYIIATFWLIFEILPFISSSICPLLPVIHPRYLNFVTCPCSFSIEIAVSAMSSAYASTKSLSGLYWCTYLITKSMYISNNLGDSMLPWRTPDSVVNHSPLPMFVLTLFLLVCMCFLSLFLSGHSIEEFFKVQKSYEKGLIVLLVRL